MTTHALWQAFSGELDRFLRRHVPSAADAEDLRQQVFLAVHRHLIDHEPPKHPRGWIYQIARNAIIDHRRRRAARPDRVPETAPLADDSAAMEDADPDATLTQELAGCLLTMLDRVPEPYQTAVRWADVEGVPQTEGAGRAGVSLPAMKARVQRGRVKLREALLACCTVEFDRQNRPASHECSEACNPKR